MDDQTDRALTESIAGGSALAPDGVDIPFADDTSTPRETALAKNEARVAGTRMAAETLGG